MFTFCKLEQVSKILCIFVALFKFQFVVSRYTNLPAWKNINCNASALFSPQFVVFSFSKDSQDWNIPSANLTLLKFQFVVSPILIKLLSFLKALVINVQFWRPQWLESICFNDEQPSKIPATSKAFSKFHFAFPIETKLLSFKNTLFACWILLVSQLLKSIDFSALLFANIASILVAEVIFHFETSILDKLSHPSNIDLKSFTFSGFQFVKFKFIKLLSPWNINVISVAFETLIFEAFISFISWSFSNKAWKFLIFVVSKPLKSALVNFELLNTPFQSSLAAIIWPSPLLENVIFKVLFLSKILFNDCAVI